MNLGELIFLGYQVIHPEWIDLDQRFPIVRDEGDEFEAHGIFLRRLAGNPKGKQSNPKITRIGVIDLCAVEHIDLPNGQAKMNGWRAVLKRRSGIRFPSAPGCGNVRSPRSGTRSVESVNGGALGIRCGHSTYGGNLMNSIIYIVGLVVVVLAVLSFFGLR